MSNSQPVVGSIVWAFRRLEKPRCREMSARGARFMACAPDFFSMSSGKNFEYWRILYVVYKALVPADWKDDRIVAM